MLLVIVLILNVLYIIKEGESMKIAMVLFWVQEEGIVTYERKYQLQELTDKQIEQFKKYGDVFNHPLEEKK